MGRVHDTKISHPTHMPELRTWYRTLRALFHLSTLLDTCQSLRALSMRSMRSCFLPDLLSIVQHSSLNPAMICLSLSTVLCLTLTLRVCGIIVRVAQCINVWRNTSKSPQGSTVDMVGYGRVVVNTRNDEERPLVRAQGRQNAHNGKHT
jgi:hypothetical protein